MEDYSLGVEASLEGEMIGSELRHSVPLLHRLIELARKIEDDVERGQILALVQQFFVLHFSPALSVAVLTKVRDGVRIDQATMDDLDYSLHLSREPVQEVLAQLQRALARHGAAFSPSERHQFEMMIYGKLNIRMALSHLVRNYSNDPTNQKLRRDAGEMLDQIELVNQNLDMASRLFRDRLIAQTQIRPTRHGLWYWVVVWVGLIAISLALAALILFADDLRGLLLSSLSEDISNISTDSN